MATIVTVDYMLRLLQRLHDNGKGDMKIKCRDNFLHEDEVAIDYMGNEMKLRGYLYNFSAAEKVKEFCTDVKNAETKFYKTIDLESEES